MESGLLRSGVAGDSRHGGEGNRIPAVGGWSRRRRATPLSSVASVALTPAGTAVAISATIYNFNIELADVDRGVYESLALRVACHPSEAQDYLFTRVLAYCLEFAEGISFGKGLAEPDEPALTVRDLTGALKLWVEVGWPDAARLHKASKAAPRLVIYTHKDPAQLVRTLAGERIHRAEAVELYAVDRELLAELVARLERRMTFSLSVVDRHLFITLGDETLEGDIVRFQLQ